MIELGIDEMTIIVFPDSSLVEDTNRRWDDIATQCIFEAENRLNLIELFGERKMLNTAISGYSVAFMYGNHDWFFSVCYHNLYRGMGILIRFSAQALAVYQQLTDLAPYQILQKLQSPFYRTRCSRIDLAVDYVNEGIDINDIYDSYSTKVMQTYVIRERGFIVEKAIKNYEYRGIFHNADCETMYFGDRKSAVMLRIYDKKKEQISKKGNRYLAALSCEDWIRFEVECKSDYAHDLTDELLRIENENEYKDLLIDFIIQKYYFTITYKDTIYIAPFTQKLIEIKNDDSILLFKRLSINNTDLSRSIIHLLRTSGTISTLFKVGAIWKTQGFEDFIKRIKDYTINTEPNNLCKRFLRNNLEDYRRLYPDFNTFYDSEVKPELEAENKQRNKQ